ncbi:MAG TPA: YihY/virulence factor BrkB family protein [Terriglobales bacterium]
MANQGGSQASPWKLGGLTVKQLGLKSWQGISADDVFGRAGQLAYFFFFAVFPFIVFVTSLLGVVAGPNSSTAHNLLRNITRGMPPQAAQLFGQTIHEALKASGGGKITFGLLLTLLTASSGMSAMMDTLNVVFGVKEGRSLMKQYATALALTIAVGLLICSAVFIVVGGWHLVNSLQSDAIRTAWKIAQYPVSIFFLLLSYSLVYYYAPNVEHPQWHWVTPGASVGVVLWIAVSFALQLYLHFFDTYTATYGSIGAVMILLLWFYVSGLAMLVGGEINAAIERAGTGQTKQQEPAESKSAAKIEEEKQERKESQDVDSKRIA